MKKSPIDEAVNLGVQSGIDSLIENHPLFKDNREYILKHIDKESLNKKLEELYTRIQGRKLKEEDKLEYLRKGIEEYTSSGSILDEAGKGIILKQGKLEEKLNKGFLGRILPFNKKNTGDEYLNQTISAFQDLYSLLGSNGQEYLRRTPEVAKAITTVYDMGFLVPAVDVLKYYGMIDNKKYAFLKSNINSKVKESSEKVIKGIEKSIITQDIVAGIFALMGISQLFFLGMSLNGAVIGMMAIEGVGTTLLNTIVPLTISAVLFWKNKRREKKNKKEKIKKK